MNGAKQGWRRTAGNAMLPSITSTSCDRGGPTASPAVFLRPPWGVAGAGGAAVFRGFAVLGALTTAVATARNSLQPERQIAGLGKVVAGVLGGEGAGSLPPPLKPLPPPQLGLLALPKGQKKGFPPTYTAQEEFFNSLLVCRLGPELPHDRHLGERFSPNHRCIPGDSWSRAAVPVARRWKIS